MKFCNFAFISVLFFVLGILAGISVVTLHFWGSTRFDYLLFYAENINAAGSYVRYYFIVVCGISALLSAVTVHYLPPKIKMVIAFVAVALFVYTFQLFQYAFGIVSTTDIYDKEYIAPNEKNFIGSNGKRNLIILYLESMEDGYRNVEGQNLLPRLSALREQNSSFPGFRQLMYADATISALTAGICGLPNKTETKLKNLFSIINSNLPNATCLSDILKTKGYNTHFIKSADIAFADTDKFVRQHGFDTVAGEEELLRKYPTVAHDAKGNDWGIKDSVLYAIAKKEILHLAEAKKPFISIITTVDTHEPTTFLDPECRQKFGDKRDVILCADKMAADFVEWVQKQSFSHNTTIAILGDHIVHGKNSVYPDRKNRQIFFTIINPEQGLKPQNHRWTTLDIAPTLLEAIGFSNNGLALGRNLWKQSPTLEEKYGLSLDSEFSKSSDFYKSLQQTAEPELNKASPYTLGKQVSDPAEISRYALAHYRKAQIIWTDGLHLKADLSKAENICMDIEFIVMFEKYDKPAVIDVSVNEKNKDKWIISADKQAPFRQKLCFSQSIIGKDKNLLIRFQRDAKTEKSDYLAIGIKNFKLYQP